MMTEIIAIHAVESTTEKYAEIKKIAIKKGFVTIRAIKESDGHYVALEGSHRLAIAHQMNLKVKIKEIKLSARKVKWSDIDNGDINQVNKMHKYIIDRAYHTGYLFNNCEKEILGGILK